MTSNYAAIRADNEIEYGAGVSRWLPSVLSDRYAERTHFIFELLQNAEDALSRRVNWQGSRAVSFHLTDRALWISHFGEPFNEGDVRGICGIAETTKNQSLTAIGRFGIGFKSVYAFAERPEVHSGSEDFAIESYVWPISAPPIERQDDKTVIILPLKPQDHSAHREIAEGLRRLGPRTLLFLRHIGEIEWRIENGPSGLCIRDAPEVVGANARRVTILGQEEGRPDVEETWLVFSRDAVTEAGALAGHVEIAFLLSEEGNPLRTSVCRVTDPPLVVFFPTVVSTNLGFLVQGPYRTTPSRDNVPPDDPWNQYLVRETATLLAEALRGLRDMNLLSAEALRVLPMDRSRFEGKMFLPLFEMARRVLRDEPLLPCFDGGQVPASRAKLARGQELRELFASGQLDALYGKKDGVAWLSGDITLDRMPELRQYMMQELGVGEVAAEDITSRLATPFLEAQSDEWIVRLYEFLNTRPAVHKRLENVAVVRLADDTHVTPKDGDGQPQAFLPSSAETGFPTVKASVCATAGANEFLRTLGLREPEPVDDVIRNILPKYQATEVRLSDEAYAVDIRRMLAAFQTDSKGQREKLTTALGEAYLVRAVDAGTGVKVMAEPGAVYLPTQRLKDLFGGIAGVLIADDSCDCLRGEQVRDLLEACGATRYVRPVPIETDLTWAELTEIRRRAGLERYSGSDIEDFSLHGLGRLLDAVPHLAQHEQKAKAQLLWDALCDMEGKRGQGAFSGTYTWYYSHASKSVAFDAAFVRRLNQAAWVPRSDGSLRPPASVPFEETGWDPDPFLLSKIHFRPQAIEALAKEAGIDPNLLTLLKTLGLTSAADLRKLLGRTDDQGSGPHPGA